MKQKFSSEYIIFVHYGKNPFSLFAQNSLSVSLLSLKNAGFFEGFRNPRLKILTNAEKEGKILVTAALLRFVSLHESLCRESIDPAERVSR